MVNKKLIGLGGACLVLIGVVASLVKKNEREVPYMTDEIFKGRTLYCEEWENRAKEIVQGNESELSMNDWYKNYTFVKNLLKHNCKLAAYDFECDDKEVNLYSKYYWCKTYYPNWEGFLFSLKNEKSTTSSCEDSDFIDIELSDDVSKFVDETSYDLHELKDLLILHEMRSDRDVNKRLYITKLYYENGNHVWKRLIDNIYSDSFVRNY